MFDKIKCQRCKEKISEKFDFCPHCGLPINSSEEDWGLLGKNDKMSNDPFKNTMLQGFSGTMLNKMLTGAMKMLEKEMQKEIKNPNQEAPMRSNFELYINGKRISPKNVKITRRGANEKPVKSTFSNQFSANNIKKFADLPKHEPAANVRRFSNKVVYELDIPGVLSLEDIAVSKLENSIEIKAISKDKAYKKLIPIDLPLRAYKLDKGKLVLELSDGQEAE